MGLRGKHTKIWVGGYDLTARSSDIAPSITFDELDDSRYGQDHSTAKGQCDSTIPLNGYYDGATLGFHQAVSEITDSEVIVSTALGENAAVKAGDITLTQVAQQVNYLMNPVKSGLITASGSFRQKGNAPEFGYLITDTTETETGSSASLDDNGASSSNGAVGILHLYGVSASDTIEVLIEDSSDDSSFSTLITFTLDGSAVGAERIEVSGTVERYVRASWTISGTDESFSFAVIFVRK